MKTWASEQKLEQPRGAETVWDPPLLLNPALADSEARVDSAL